MAVVSVIIATYRRERFLELALASLIAQTFSEWEALVVDGTEDGSRLDIDDRRVRYFRERDHRIAGLADARSFGVRQSTAKYIAYLDDDEYYYPTKLEAMVNFLEREADGAEFAYHDVVVAVVEWVEGRLRHVCVPRRHWHPEGDPNQVIRTVPFVAGLQAVHTRALYERVGGFRGDRGRGIVKGRYGSRVARYDEDADLFRRMAACTRLAHVPLQLAEYRVHGGNVNAWGIDYEQARRDRFLKKAEY